MTELVRLIKVPKKATRDVAAETVHTTTQDASTEAGHATTRDASTGEDWQTKNITTT